MLTLTPRWGKGSLSFLRRFQDFCSFWSRMEFFCHVGAQTWGPGNWHLPQNFRCLRHRPKISLLHHLNQLRHTAPSFSPWLLSISSEKLRVEGSHWGWRMVQVFWIVVVPNACIKHRFGKPWDDPDHLRWTLPGQTPVNKYFGPLPAIKGKGKLPLVSPWIFLSLN